MRRAIAASRRLLACIRGTALVGYSSLTLLFAIAAIALLGHGNAGGGLEPPRSANVISSD
jgi:hypothetical protein